MLTVVWLTEGTWPACVDAVQEVAGTDVVLLHVIDPDTVEAATGPQAGLLGRGAAASRSVETVLADAEARLFDAAEERLGRPAERLPLRGRTEREVVAACADAGLLIVARDGERTRLGPRSIGRATRFVLDHAPCRVLLVWPDAPPDPATLPPPPPPGAAPPPPPGAAPPPPPPPHPPHPPRPPHRA